MGNEEITRLRRENCTHVKHCKVFSNWAVLIGPSDWEDHHLRKEGSERYRVHNLPLSCSCPGLYELGIASPCSVLSQKKRKIKCRDVIVVYLGQADNVRTRLQNYGRDGSHLEGNSSSFDSQKRSVSFHQQSNVSNNELVKQSPGLFTEIFSRGFFIMFRWSATSSKEIAEQTESRLLNVFDYAWNRGGNFARRPHDVLAKLEKLTSQNMTKQLLQTLIEMQWMPCVNKAGISIEAHKPLKISQKTIPRINFGLFSFTRNQPHSLSKRGENKNHNPPRNICGVILHDGSICNAAPLKNRKRCLHHKGQKIVKVKLTAEIADPTEANSNGLAEEKIHECGVVLDDGFKCRTIPEKGRKRCNVHKGMRVKVSQK